MYILILQRQGGIIVRQLGVDGLHLALRISKLNCRQHVEVFNTQIRHMSRVRQLYELSLLSLNHFDEVVSDGLLVDFELMNHRGLTRDLLYLILDFAHFIHEDFAQFKQVVG